jgi:hypothetical protein
VVPPLRRPCGSAFRQKSGRRYTVARPVCAYVGLPCLSVPACIRTSYPRSANRVNALRTLRSCSPVRRVNNFILGQQVRVSSRALSASARSRRRSVGVSSAGAWSNTSMISRIPTSAYPSFSPGRSHSVADLLTRDRCSPPQRRSSRWQRVQASSASRLGGIHPDQRDGLLSRSGGSPSRWARSG